jgi:hypothetical protein
MAYELQFPAMDVLDDLLDSDIHLFPNEWLYLTNHGLLS